jgi:hypothetical protein
MSRRNRPRKTRRAYTVTKRPGRTVTTKETTRYGWDHGPVYVKEKSTSETKDSDNGTEAERD